jgi:hypothetical protein
MLKVLLNPTSLLEKFFFENNGCWRPNLSQYLQLAEIYSISSGHVEDSSTTFNFQTDQWRCADHFKPASMKQQGRLSMRDLAACIFLLSSQMGPWPLVWETGAFSFIISEILLR